MSTRNLLFQVYHGGVIDRRQNEEYVGGKTDVYHEPYDEDELSWIEIQTIMTKYGYNPGDLVYYRQSGLGMHNGLKLLTSDHDVLSMASALQGKQVAHLYLVSHSRTLVRQSFLHDHYVEEDVSEDERDGEDEEEAEARRLGFNNPFWKEVLSSEDELYDIDVNTVGISRSKPVKPRSKCVDDKEPQSHSDAEHEEDEGRSLPLGTSQDRRGLSWPEEDDIGNLSDMAPSDVLQSLVPSGDEGHRDSKFPLQSLGYAHCAPSPSLS